MKKFQFFLWSLLLGSCSMSKMEYEPINYVKWHKVVSGAGGGKGYQFYAYFFKEDLDPTAFIVNDVFVSVTSTRSGDTTIVSGYYFEPSGEEPEYPPKQPATLFPPFTKAIVNGYLDGIPFSWETVKFVEMKLPPNP